MQGPLMPEGGMMCHDVDTPIVTVAGIKACRLPTGKQFGPFWPL